MKVKVRIAYLFLAQRFSCYSIGQELSILYEIRLRLSETSSHNVFLKNQICLQLRKRFRIYPYLKHRVQNM